VSKFVNRKPSNFGIAGNKDKRGVTSQRVTLFHATEEELENVQRKRGWNQSITLGDYKYVDRELKMGDLIGNRFSLSLRFINVDDDSLIQKSMEDLKNFGFINYYGLQRFGSTNIKTHAVGVEALRKNWKKVVEMILSQSDIDPNVVKAKKDFLENYDFKTALKQIPFKNKLDRVLIEGLRTHGKANYHNAFMAIPRNTRELYGHAYQSYLWNRTASIRLKKYGMQPIVGDFVLKNKTVLQELEADDQDESLEGDNNEKEEEKVEEKKEEENTEKKEEDGKDKNRRKRLADYADTIAILDENTVKQYTIDDVVIPLYGDEIKFPENNPLGEIIMGFLKDDAVTLEDFSNSKQDFFIRGGYRPLLAKPRDVQWEIVRYQERDVDLLTPYYNKTEDPKGDPNGKYKAIKLRISLNKSVYATMCIRELTKTSTSFDMQNTLTSKIQ